MDGVHNFLVERDKGLQAGEQGWNSGESTRLAPVQVLLGFNSRTRRHMWVEFVVGSRPCSKRGFSPGTPVFPSPAKNQQFSVNSNKNTIEHNTLLAEVNFGDIYCTHIRIYREYFIFIQVYFVP